jgi:hypothetical protein
MSTSKSRLRLPVTGSLLVVVAVALAWTASASAATWTIQTTPNASGAEHSALYDISCEGAGTKACISVGKQIASGGVSGPYAQVWNGTAWSNQTTVSPEGATAGELQSVDCHPELLFGAMLCFAAGSYTSSGVTKSLIENSTVSGTWSLQTTPNPEGATETAFKGIACRHNIGGCIAVGYSVKSGVKSALIERYTESKWVIQTVPTPEGATSSELHGIDCVSTTFCMAVGSYSLSAEQPQWAWSATWNGSSWTLKNVAKPPAEPKRSTLLDVSCSSTSSCTGVGGYRNSSNVQVSFVERWNGTSWSYQSSPNPAGTTNTVFQGVSCVASAPCVAVGDWNNGKIWQPMAQEWNGSAWALDTVPLPAGAGESILEGVACRVSCLASGWYIDSGGKMKTLGETR